MKKKIMFIIPSFQRGGVERVTLNIINSLDIHHFNIYLIICKQSNNDMLSYLRTQINVIELKKNNIRNSFPHIVRLLRKINPHIIFTSFDHLSLLVIIIKLTTGIQSKIISRINSLPSNKLVSNIRDKIYRLFFKKLVRKATIVIAQTIQMKNDILNCYNIDCSKVKVINNIIDVKGVQMLAEETNVEIIKSQNHFTLVAIGSLGHVKGYDLLIKAIHSLYLSGIKDIKLYIIGDNRERNEDYRGILTKMIEEYNAQSYIVLLGYKKNPYPYLKQADTLVLPSRKEGFPNVVLEALALEKPCLVTNCVDFTGIIVNGVNGVIVEKDSVSALEEGLGRIRKIKNISGFKIKNFNYNTWFKRI